MHDVHRQYKEELETLDRMLGNVWNILDQIAKRMSDRAWLSYPNEADVSDLNEVHERLTATADKIIDRMQSLHKELSNLANSE